VSFEYILCFHRGNFELIFIKVKKWHFDFIFINFSQSREEQYDGIK
jgi:hypothetical protein